MGRRACLRSRCDRVGLCHEHSLVLNPAARVSPIASPHARCACVRIGGSLPRPFFSSQGERR